MSNPFIDQKAQYKALQLQTQEPINRVSEYGEQFMNLEVKEFEVRLQDYEGAKYCALR